MARTNDADLRADFELLKEAAQGYLDDNRFITPGLRHDGPPELNRLPNIDDMRNLTNEELAKLLEHYGILEPIGMQQTAAMDYVRRMMPLRSEEDIRAAYNELINNERRQLLGLNRRVAQQWSTLDAIDGDMEKEMIWIAEDDEATCDSCAPRSGEIATFREWKQRGMPGAEVCRGGDYCRCDLVVID